MATITRRKRAAATGSDVLERVRAVAENLWWTWNTDAQRLFAAMDPALFAATNQNPIRTMSLLTPERRAALEGDELFGTHLVRVERALKEYLSSETWFDRTYPQFKRGKRPLRIAYFCAEYAVHESLPQYSGGLGVLAGDHLKSASDLGIPLVAVGLLYRNGFYTQEFRPDGSTRVIYPQLDFSQYPLKDIGLTITVPLGRRSVQAKVWRQLVGRTQVFLLDTDIPENSPRDRALTRHLYGGDREYRIQQEILLGVGGLIALDRLGLEPTVQHLNEGHAAFACLERLRWQDTKVPLEERVRWVRGASVFTTHTPVPAGNDRFAPQLAMKYLGRYAEALGLSRDKLLALGREDPADKSEEFCMTVLALRLAAHCNGVAALHGDTSRRMWMKVFDAADPAEVPIGHVTNGVHVQTWLAPEMEPLYDRYLKPKWIGAGPDDNWWARVDAIPDEELWAARQTLRSKLVNFVRSRLAEQVLRRNGTVEELAAARSAFDEDALTIGFARRFATYKRATLIFRDPKRLARILNNPARPVQLVFAGKAHPADLGGQAFAQEIYRLSGRYAGRVVLLEDYDLQVGRVLTAGADVWLNNPLRPQEASGTSGMKGPLHGGINCSILDGWWPEAYDGRNGWAIGDGRTFSSQAKQDRYDADALYDLLENQIVPEFYRLDRSGLPRQWIARMKRSMRTVAPVFNTHRMLAEYLKNYYLPAHQGRGGSVASR